MQNLLKDRVAIITGGGRGIGRAIAEKYASEGCCLALFARSLTELEETARAIRSRYDLPIFVASVDIANEEEVRHGVDQTLKEFKKIDILVNNAGTIGPIGPLAGVDTQEWDKAIRINVNGTFYCLKAVLPPMLERRSGRILNIASGAGVTPSPFFDAYAVSKAAMIRLTENLAMELKDSGVTVSAILPGGVNTRMFDDMMAAGEEKVGPKLWKSFLTRKEQGGETIDSAVELALRAVTDLAEVIHGRVISTKWDSWRTFSEHCETILPSDLFTMRRIVPKDRGFSW